MSDAVSSQRNRLWKTPLRDLLRGRITGRLDWETPLTDLPDAARELIRGVVKRTRLWQMEKATVAGELAAHFHDGLAAGSSADDLVARFGDPRTAAKLIRRSKRRNRPMIWHLWAFAFRITVAIVAIYLLLIVRFCIGRPDLKVDYIARMNEPVLKTPEADRAWPIWEKAILAASDGFKDGAPVFSDATGQGREPTTWPQTAAWLNQHTQAIELARQAGQKPVLGVIYGPGGSQDDRQLAQHTYSQGKDKYGRKKGEENDDPLITLLLPHLNYARTIANLLALDARRGAELNDAARVEADLRADLGLARQLRESDGILVTQLVALGIQKLVVDRLEHILVDHPDLLSDAQLIAFAHLLSGPRVAADLIGVRGERNFFYDVVQRVYTDDGDGDGRITLKGMQMLPMFVAVGASENPTAEGLMEVASPVPMVFASRAEMTGMYDQFMDQTEANFQKPVRQINWEPFRSQIVSMHTSPIRNMRYILVTTLLPSLQRSQEACEQYLGERDGTLVAISLELYHRRHGVFPASLSDLVPELLPQIPVDRITGDLVKYRLIDGKPVVYSIGADRIDDGGKRPVKKGQYRSQNAADQWDVKPADAPRGDWVLYPPEPEDADYN